MDLSPIRGALSIRQNNNGPFLCKICSKAFDKQPSRNRHVLYCRKKLQPSEPVLRKSCAACRKAKVRCDSEYPSCRRCTEKIVDCVYEKTSRSSLSSRTPPTTLGSETLRAEPAVLPATTPTVSSKFNHIQDERDVGDMQFENYYFQPTSDIDLSSQNSVFSPLDWEPESSFIGELERPKSSNNLDWIDDLHDSSFINWPPAGISRSLTVDPTFSIPPDFISYQSPFTHSYVSPASQIGRRFLLQNIKAYGLMLSTTELPPFIHNSVMHAQGPAGTQPESLAICKNIVQMYTNRTPQTRSFIWRTIAMEKDRMMAEYLDVDEQSVLAMLQAITIYILLRIFDNDDTFTVDFDRQLVEAMTVIAMKSEQSGFLCVAELENGRPDWSHWTMLESKRRTVTLLFMIHLLFDIKPEQRSKSRVGLSVLPLPAHGSLWKASTEAEWLECWEQLAKDRNGRKYLSYADLSALMARGNAGLGERMKDLDAWMVSNDPFGIMVMMSVTTLCQH